MGYRSLIRQVSGKTATFCSHCSLHGFYYLAGSAPRLVRALWCIVILAGFTLCTILSILIWEKFDKNPTFTVVESAHFPTEDIPFAAVAVCDQQVYGPATTKTTNILTLRGFNASQLTKFYESFVKIKSKHFTSDSEVARMHSVLEELHFSYYDLLYELKKPCSDLVKECSWRGRTFDCSFMFREVFTIYGHCCQFDVNYFTEFAGNDTNLSAGVLKLEALDIIVDSMKVYPNGTVRDGYVMLYIFDQDNQLSLLDSPISLIPATYFDVRIDVWIIEAGDEIKNLQLGSRKCFLDSDNKTYHSCVSNHLMKQVVAACLCLPFNYVDDDKETLYSPCQWPKLGCVYQALDNAQRHMRTIISQRECYQTCDYVQYETKTDYSKPTRLRGIKSSKKENSGLSRVTVHFADNLCIKYRREVLYTWDQMLANFGGIFGLCLGGSIISIIELVWFIFDILATIIHYLCTKEKNKVVKKAWKKNKNSIVPKYPFVN
ncbi:unnamed protein product [Pieris macdunnoughi]|uniref:Uncharacterized protein n=1 Tax=Pieris macdunnoughi TaxID=345717 RepID=A0A821W4X0_9NEOP|nr:unnamed protein product [Pieris macdunnoughi]